jgi:hypothetical protein
MRPLSATYAVRSCLYPARARAYGGRARIERPATGIGQPAAAPPRGHYWSTGRLISRIGRRGSRYAAPLVLRRIVDDLPARGACMHACMEESEQRDYRRPAHMTTTTTGTTVPVRCLAVNLGDADTPPSSAPTRLYNGTDAPLHTCVISMHLNGRDAPFFHFSRIFFTKK